LLPLLADDVKICIEVIRALSDFQATESIPFITALLVPGINMDVRIAAAGYLGNFEEKAREIVQNLLPYSRDPNVQFREAIYQSLGRKAGITRHPGRHGEYMAALLDGIADPGREVRYWSWWGLQLVDPRSMLTDQASRLGAAIVAETEPRNKCSILSTFVGWKLSIIGTELEGAILSMIDKFEKFPSDDGVPSWLLVMISGNGPRLAVNPLREQYCHVITRVLNEMRQYSWMKHKLQWLKDAAAEAGIVIPSSTARKKGKVTREKYKN
nr:HEAT repeat domain-containing protein [Candidatus Sigynarchaeota archaeon]